MFAQLAAGQTRGLGCHILPFALHSAFPASASSPAHRAGLLARVKSLAHLRPTREDGREAEGWRRTDGGKRRVLSSEFFFLLLGRPAGVTLHHCSLSKLSNYLCICLKSSLLLGTETSGAGPVPHDTKQASTALGSPAQQPGLGGAASYAERAGSFPCNEID